MKQQASYKGEKHNCKEELVVTFDLSQPFTLELQVVSDYSWQQSAQSESTA